jgi:fucose permease
MPEIGHNARERVGQMERRHIGLYAGVASNFVWYGASITVLGAILPRAIQEFSWSYVDSGFVLAASSLGFFLSTFACGFLAGRFGLKAVAVAGLLVVAAGSALFGILPGFLFNGLIGFLIGIGHGGIEVTVNTAVVRLERHGEHHLMGFTHAAFSVGAVAGPLAAGAVMVGGLAWQTVYRILAGVFLAAAIVQLVLPYRELPEPAPPESAPRGRALRPLVVLGALLIFVYVGIEFGVSNWSAEYGVSLFGIDAARAAVLVSLFWGGLLAGRLLIPLAARRLPLATQLIGLCLMNAGMVVFVALARTPMMLALAVLLAGVGASSIYPLTVTIVGKQLKEQQSVGIGVMSTLGGIGSFSFPYIMALIAERSDLRAGFVFIAAMGGLLVLLGFGIRLRLRQTAR